MNKNDFQLTSAYAQLRKYEREVKNSSGVWKALLNEKIEQCKATIKELEGKQGESPPPKQKFIRSEENGKRVLHSGAVGKID